MAKKITTTTRTKVSAVRARTKAKPTVKATAKRAAPKTSRTVSASGATSSRKRVARGRRSAPVATKPAKKPAPSVPKLRQTTSFTFAMPATPTESPPAPGKGWRPDLHELQRRGGKQPN